MKMELNYMKYNPKTNAVIWKGSKTTKQPVNLWGFSLVK